MNIIGIDVSKDKLDCAWLREQDKVKTKVMANRQIGWQELLEWSLKNTGLAVSDLHFVMEATGVYHEQLATFLYDRGAKVSVVNPAHVKFYAQSLGIRNKNDKKDSVVLARYGLKEQPPLWQPEAIEIRTCEPYWLVLMASKKTCNVRKIAKKKHALVKLQTKCCTH